MTDRSPTVEELQKVIDTVHQEMVHGKPLAREEIIALVDESARKALRGRPDPWHGEPGLCLPMPPQPDDPIRNQAGVTVGYLRGARVEKLEGFTRVTMTFDLALTGTTKGLVDPQLLEELKHREPDSEGWEVDLEEEFS